VLEPGNARGRNGRLNSTDDRHHPMLGKVSSLSGAVILAALIEGRKTCPPVPRMPLELCDATSTAGVADGTFGGTDPLPKTPPYACAALPGGSQAFERTSRDQQGARGASEHLGTERLGRAIGKYTPRVGDKGKNPKKNKQPPNPQIWPCWGYTRRAWNFVLSSPPENHLGLPTLYPISAADFGQA